VPEPTVPSPMMPTLTVSFFMARFYYINKIRFFPVNLKKRCFFC
jgi:hypothetical protein